MNIITASGLTKKYGELTAVDGLDLSVGKEIYGLLGPNGSGKTTSVGMLTTLVKPTSGDASVCGYDIRTQGLMVRSSISYVPQDMAVDIRLTGRENVDLFARLYGISDRRERNARVEDALSVMGLLARADDRTKTFSGGMRRRLELAQALVHNPEVLFLDEPTIGLDVAARKTIWEHITELRKSGMAVFVTTHHMDEAERYCDRVGILKRGVLCNEGTPQELVSTLDDVISVRYVGNLPKTFCEGVKLVDDDGEKALFSSTEGSERLGSLLECLLTSGVKILSTSVREPTLEDAYIQSVGPGSDELGTFNEKQFRNMIRRSRK